VFGDIGNRFWLIFSLQEEGRGEESLHGATVASGLTQALFLEAVSPLEDSPRYAGYMVCAKLVI